MKKWCFPSVFFYLLFTVAYMLFPSTTYAATTKFSGSATIKPAITGQAATGSTTDQVSINATSPTKITTYTATLSQKSCSFNPSTFVITATSAGKIVTGVAVATSCSIGSLQGSQIAISSGNTSVAKGTFKVSGGTLTATIK